MDCSAFPEQNVEKNVCIVGSEPVENYTVYIIEVKVGDHRWTIKHRYSDFHDLHEKLTSEKKIDKHLLPPKKIIGKNSKSLVEKRQKELEVYLQTLLSRFPVAAPKVLSIFLLFHLYEINGIAATLAEDLFHRGEQLLVAGEVFLLRPLQLYAITQQLKLAKPTCANGDAKADLGHILDFACRLKYLKIPGTKGVVGTSNIEEHSLQFDLSVFKSLLQIEITDCSSAQIKGLPSLKPTLATLSIHLSAASMKEILVPESAEFAQWEPEGVAIDCPVTAIIPTWKMLTTLDMSRNFICSIDESVKLIPEVEFLDLSHNELTLVENLQHLYNLVHLDLSYNKLTVLEGVHTKLGNIKTLNLAGNQLETLSGLSKLYSLVNLDLSSNRLAQLDEIKHIGTLPCLEKLCLTNNPMCIIPDYRTKVLAQFWDRASEVCLDGTVTTEKELDTVEVLKAIQKAKEVKDRMANNEKKISDVPKHAEGGSKSSSSSCSLAAPPSSSPPLSHFASSSQEVACKDEAFVTKEISTHVDSTLPQRCCIKYNSSCEEPPQVKTQLGSCSSPEIPCESLTFDSSGCFYCKEDPESWTSRLSTPVLPFCYLSYSTNNLDFQTLLSASISQADSERTSPRQCRTTSLEVTHQGSPDSGGGYFEMGLDKCEDIMGCSSSSSTVQDKELEDVERAGFRINLLVWCHCISVAHDAGVSQRTCCLAATESLLVVFQTRPKDLPSSVRELTDSLEIGLMVPYSDIEAFQFDIPDTCISLKVRSSDPKWWYFFSDGQNLKEMHSHVELLMSTPSGGQASASSSIQLFIQQFLNSWEIEENDIGVKSGLLVHVLDRASLFTPSREIPNHPRQGSVPSDVLSTLHESHTSIPLVLFLTTRHLCVLKVDFAALASKDSTEGTRLRSCAKLTRIPLASTLLNPKHGCVDQSNSVAHRFCNGHVLELMAGHDHLAVVFALPHDKFLFLRQFSQFRASLRDIKTIALLQTRRLKCTTPSKTSQRVEKKSVPQDLPKPHLTLSLLYPGETLIQQLSDENQSPCHLSLSSSLHYLSSLRGEDLVTFFHDNIAEVENEELKHILWTSVLFYKSPDVEMTACIMLSTKAVYFILDDAASSLSDQAMMWSWHPSEHKDADFLISFCFAMKLNELQSVNVGLFDQYFRVVGPSAEHIISCLTRDSYSTHHFLQQLMTVLSLLEKVPSPEPSEQDFYTQFGKKSTGKMENYELVHSSKVKFVYPSEEEIGDLTFIVAERKGPQGSSQSFNILFYVLVFQVRSVPGPSSEKQHLLQPKTLILTSTDVFLLDEDYISYPLPEFAKEPPQRDKYCLTDARRIRDLDRVLMGYQTYPQALTLVFDDVPGPDLLCHLTMDHFADEQARGDRMQGNGGAESEVQWCIFVPGAESRERLISLLARQWEALCSRELPVELTG
ncbi:nischarin isoform X1 [Salminus brasiliensis]|uniref:nischarin isoform X1 n=1 Tax=Salminus brasiliensis TaxID=930266 RepID=UPI003B8357F5